MAEVVKKIENLVVSDNQDGAQKPAKKEKKKDIPQNPLMLNPQPEFIESRIKMFDELKAQYDAEIAAKERKDIKITLKDGSVRVGTAYETTPLSIAIDIGKSFSERQVISKVNGTLWDLERRCVA